MGKLRDLRFSRIDSIVTVLAAMTTKPMTMRMIEKDTHHTHNFICYIINALERNGFVATERLGRVRNCWITEKGKALLKQLQMVGE